MFMSCHCAMMNCDHLVDLCKNSIHDSKIASKLKMHHTKCSGIIKNVLSTHFGSHGEKEKNRESKAKDTMVGTERDKMSKSV